MDEPSIDKYFISNCLFTIDEFNEMYKSLSKEELKEIADNDYNEMDICVKIGSPFKNLHYTVGDRNGKIKVNHDLYIKSKDFKVEVKYLKNWTAGNGGKCASKSWAEYQADFDWLEDEIRKSKGKRAFIIGWFNCVDRFSQLIQLGCTKGVKPLVDENRLIYFPFLKRVSTPTYTKDLVYNYDYSYEEMKVKLRGRRRYSMNCMLIGNKNDKFHFAIYY